MNGRDIIRALHDGHRVYASALIAPAPYWPKAAKEADIDFVFIDSEHVPMDRQTLAWMCLAYQGVGIPPVVRIPCNDPFEACKALDAGAGGVIGPYVESPDQVRALVGAVKLRPLKGERLQEALRDPGTLEPELKTYLDKHNGDRILIVNIESVPASRTCTRSARCPGWTRC